MKRILGLLLGVAALVFSFTVSVTGSPAQTSFRFISWGDAQDQGRVSPITSNQIAALNPAFTIFTGDLSNDGVILDPTGQNLESMQVMAAALNGGPANNGLFDRTFLVRGNHDDHYVNPADWESFLVAANRPLPAGVANYSALDPSSTYLIYSFDYGNSRFIGVDVPGSVNDLTPAGINWIDQRLADAETSHPELVHAFVFFHGPTYCIGYHCACTAADDPACIPSEASSLISVFNHHPILSATFHGHEHDLAWTHISSVRIAGVTHEYEQFVTSPSGQSSADAYLKPLRVDYAAMVNSQGFASIDVDGTEFTVSFYKVEDTLPVWTRTFSKSPSYMSPTPGPTSTPSGIVTVSSRVSASKDDAEESIRSGSVDLTSTDLELAAEGTTLQLVGLRFNDLAIPRGAAVVEAHIEFEVDETGSTPTSLRIFGQAADNPSDFTSADGNISARPRTVSQVLWTGVLPWNITSAKKLTPDISPIIQEIVDLPGWLPGNSIVLMIDGTGTRTAEAYDGEIPAAARLIVSYLPTPPPSLTPTPTPPASATPTSTAESSSTPEASSTPVFTLEPSETSTSTASPSSSLAPTGTPEPSSTPSPSLTSEPSPTPTQTLEPSETFTSSPSPTPTATLTPSFTPTPTASASPTPTATPLPSPTPTPVSIAINPVADSYVRSDKPAGNYGTKTTAVVDGSPVMIAYLKFDLSSLAGRDISRAVLRLKVANDASSGAQTIRSVAGTAWTESGLTYNNRPALGASLASFTSPLMNTWIEIDITSQVIASRGQLMSLGIDETNSNSMNLYTRESASNRPVLIVYY